MKRRIVTLGIAALIGAGGSVSAGPNLPSEPEIAADPARPWLVPPVDGPIVGRWRAPGTDWGPGHRGLDFYSAPETAVRAAASGRVSFAGRVAGVNAVTIVHAGDMASTYTDLAEVLVARGAYVLQGEWIGRSGVAHKFSGEVGVHFGVKVAGAYVNPEDYLGPIETSGAIYLTPLIGGWAARIDGYGAGSYLDTNCRNHGSDGSNSYAAPNQNIVVVVPGLASQSINGFDEAVFDLAGSLGYPEHRQYFFSYKGSVAGDLHQRFERIDTYMGLREAGRKLAVMLVRLADLHPDAGVDLLAYSQGGLVARYALELMMSPWERGLPRIEHLVTYATPHMGSKLAEAPSELSEGSISGAILTDALSRWARRGGFLPDPNSATVADLRPDSDFLNELADHDVVYGARVLSLAAPNDWIVPPTRSSYWRATNDVVPSSGLSGHGAILRSTAARDVAHAFLRDAQPECPTALDYVAPTASGVVDFAHDHAADFYGTLEEALLTRGLGRLRPSRGRD
jgi:triacylglycerol esterase/lipase EstA (alpha/beta hydrolase family)